MLLAKGRVTVSFFSWGWFFPSYSAKATDNPAKQHLESSGYPTASKRLTTGERQHPAGMCPPLRRAGWLPVPSASCAAQSSTGAVTIYPPFPGIPLKLLLLSNHWASLHPGGKPSPSSQAKFPGGKEDTSSESWTKTMVPRKKHFLTPME